MSEVTRKMVVVDRTTGTVEHHMFRDVRYYLNAGDVVVLNDTKVMSTLLRGRTNTGAEGRMDLASDKDDGRWESALRRIAHFPPAQISRSPTVDGAPLH